VDRLLYQQTGAGDTGLTSRSEDTRDYAFDRVIHGGVLEDDVRRFTAEFERDRL
jgi:hypothetical protein